MEKLCCFCDIGSSFLRAFQKCSKSILWLWYMNWNKRVCSERRKSHFRGSRFQNFPGEDTPGPPYRCEVLCMHQSAQELDPPLVYMQQILYDKFSYDKFYLLVWTCQQVYFDNLLVASWPITSNGQITLTSFLCWPIQTNKICTLTIFSMTSALVQKLACYFSRS
jgi:hypothetical protein